MSKFEIVPIAQMQTGLFIKGALVGQARAVELTDKKSGRKYTKFVHELRLKDCSEALKFVIKDDKGAYVDHQPSEDDKIALWTTKTLHEKLDMFPEGTLVSIKEDGQEDAGGDFKRRKFIVKMEK